MAPPRRIVRQQLEILVDFLEENMDMSKGLPSGSPMAHQPMRQKWADLAKKLNYIKAGALKSPEGWKKYWFEWRHKCRKKATDARRFQSGPLGGPTRFVPLNDLEVRVLELSGKGPVTASTSKKTDNNLLADDSDSEPLENIKGRSAPEKNKTQKYLSTAPNWAVNADDTRSITPPPKWAIEFEERRLAAEERMAESLESVAVVMRAQEERRAVLQERIADAITAIAGTVQDLNSGAQEALQLLQQYLPVKSNGPDIKDVFL